MINLQINKNQFSDLLNLINGVFFPLKHFVNKSDFKNILHNRKISKSFFPMPIFFGVTKKDYNKFNQFTWPSSHRISLLNILTCQTFLSIIQLCSITITYFSLKHF